jgi:hypothetical protein
MGESGISYVAWQVHDFFFVSELPVRRTRHL